ncbi:MAG: carbohydrate binding family 9 domain-containing protein [Gemmatimonadaceae bacterium]|nr:carbohydrate binding family 9 domain-containing protein [Gemmatimonadaceae bacterium]
MPSFRFALAIVLVLPAAPTRAQAPAGARLRLPPASTATRGIVVRAQRPLLIDGRDDDEVWRSAPVMDQFRQFTPAEDADPSFRTEIRAAWDDRYLYVVVRAFDPHPDSIVRLLSRRDVRTNSDQIKVLIDGYQDRRNGIQLMLNPAGVKRDASIYGDYVEDMTWDGIWDGAARVDSLGWVAEFAIPFGQIRFNPGQTAFGFGVWRDIARLSERVAWPAYRQSSQTLASQLGTLEGFERIRRGSRLELLPYTVTRNVTEAKAEGWSHPQQIAGGLDVKLGLGSNLTMDATVNPDFGQVEVDPAVLNLTAFEIRFEERRPFFQEGVGLFRCGGPCEGIFYTRRIGRAPQLRTSSSGSGATTILGAAKLTGRLGKGVSIGVVEAVTRREVGADGETIEPRTNYLVLRALKEARQGRSAFGVMATALNRDLEPATDPFLRRDAYTLVAQGYHRFAREKWEAMLYTGRNVVHGSAQAIARTQLSPTHAYQRPDHEERYDPTRTSLGGSVIGGSLAKLVGAVRYNTFLRAAGPGLEANDMGFVPVVNDVSFRQNLSYQTLRPGAFYRRTFSQLSTEQHWTTGGLPAGSSVSAHASAEFLNFWGGAITWRVADIGASHCVACARGGPAIRQSIKQELDVNLSGDARRAVVPGVEVGLRRGDGGRSHGWSAGTSLEVRLASRFSMSVAPNYEHRTDDQQWIRNYGALLADSTHFTFARLDQRTLMFTARANWTMSPNLSFQLYGQPFVSSGAFEDWREVADARAPTYAERYRSYGGGAIPEGFNVKQFNSNAVMRWEYRPGSTLFVVWQQGRRQDGHNAGTFEFARDYRDLFRAHPDNTLLVKVSWWLNP